MMKQQVSQSRPYLGVIEGLAAAAAASILGILLFALVIKVFTLPDTVIPTVNQVIKALSILLGTFLAVRRGAKGLLGGLAVGAGYMLLGMVLYTVLDGTLMPWGVMLGDLLLGSAVGAVGGVLLANLLRK